MSVYKQLLASDILVTPLEVSKNFPLNSLSEATGSGVDRFLGKNITGLFSTSEATTGHISTEYQRLVYNSIKELYYSNYQSSSYGDPVSVPEFIPNEFTSGPVSSAGRYENYLQTDLTFERYFPTASDSTVGVISIPKHLYGDKVLPNSFSMTDFVKGVISDDGEGNLIMNTTPNTIVGNIIYQHGVVVITKDTAQAVTGIINSFISEPLFRCAFSSSYTIYETQYKCTINPSEYNFSLNETLLSGSSAFTYNSSSYYQPEGGALVNFATGSIFNPYITGIGLYNDDQELLGIAKLAQPLPTSTTSDTTILINLDR
tara:strand:- start:303 stop:1250 length:948 start_codon:yes stop_codon:yes gene_type:complete